MEEGLLKIHQKVLEELKEAKAANYDKDSEIFYLKNEIDALKAKLKLQTNECLAYKASRDYELSESNASKWIFEEKYELLHYAISKFFEQTRKQVSSIITFRNLDLAKHYIACYDNRNVPIKCPFCGSEHLEDKYESYLDGRVLMEYDIFCNTCGHKVGFYNTGNFYPMYNDLVKGLYI